MRRYFNLILMGAVITGFVACASYSEHEDHAEVKRLDPLVPREEPQKFSVQEDGALPKGWSFYRVAPYKKNTAYRLQNYQGRTVLKAESNQSASGLAVKLKPRPSQHL